MAQPWTAASTSSAHVYEASTSDETSHTGNATQPSSSNMTASSHGGHKRSLSGSILARLPFLRASHEELPFPKLSQKNEGEATVDDKASSSKAGTAPKSSMSVAVSKTRRRKGSLRKTAILGTREKRGSVLDDQVPHVQGTRADSYFTLEPASADSSAESTPAREEYSHSWSLQQQQQLATLDSSDGSPPKPPPPAMHPSGSPVIAASSGTYTSTTDDDEGLSLTITRSPSTAARATYLQPAGSSLLRRRSTVKPSPLTRDVSPAVSPAEWDYSETEWWGWAILVFTWIVFVVGMGSCLGVWSWAWDVGETPRAPPELEDDPTLPIVGYYPALMVLTAVMAWVWVIVAWVGIKTFRHAKVVGDE